jgi:acyl-CoA thioesterase-1
VGTISRRRVSIRPASPAFKSIDDDRALPRVLLIGDSISIGYTLDTRRLLAGKANVHRIPDNGAATVHGLEKLDGWLGDSRWHVIHFNWCLHDVKLVDGKHQVALQDYEQNLRELVLRLKATGAKLTWASTTPVPPVPVEKLEPPRRTADVPAYNAVARRVMEDNGVPIDDLYAFALSRLGRIQRPANVHFTEEGSAELAAEVAASILQALGKH